MERRDFCKTAGFTGLCACFVTRALADESAPASSPPAPKEDWRVEFGKQRYSKLVSLVSTKLDEPTFRNVIEEVGAFCSGTGFVKEYAGRLKDYLAEIDHRWGAKSSVDEAHSVVKIAFDTPNGDCACPLMSKGSVPGMACHCSVGAMRHSLSVASGKKATVELNESVLQGGKRCAFTIHLQAS